MKGTQKFSDGEDNSNAHQDRIIIIVDEGGR